MTADLDAALAAVPPEPESAVTLVPSGPRRHRHAWGPRKGEGRLYALAASENWDGGGAVCVACGVERDPVRSRHAKNNRQRGNAQEREWCKRLGLRRVGHFGGPEDGIAADGMFVGQAKSLATHRFPGWMSDELAKLPRTEGRIPILGLLETPGAARDHRPRRLIVMTEEDFVSLHVANEEER